MVRAIPLDACNEFEVCRVAQMLRFIDDAEDGTLKPSASILSDPLYNEDLALPVGFQIYIYFFPFSFNLNSLGHTT